MSNILESSIDIVAPEASWKAFCTLAKYVQSYIFLYLIFATAGPHQIVIKWKNSEIKGSPFTCKVAESAELLRQNTKYGGLGL